MLDNNTADTNTTQYVILLAIGIVLYLMSGLGFFSSILDFSESIQSHYRIQIDGHVDDVEDVFRAIGDIGSLKKQRDEYRQELIETKSQLSEYEKVIDDYEKKELQIDRSFDPVYDYIPSRVIRYEKYIPGQLIVNKGEADGINIGDNVIYLNYVVGEVIEVNTHSSVVQLIISPDTKIPVVSQNDAVGILYSKNGGELIVEKIGINSDVSVGDRFYTQGKNSSYFDGLYIGDVVEVISDVVDSSQSVRLDSELNIENLDEVFIIKYEK